MPWWFALVSFFVFLVIFLIIHKARSALKLIDRPQNTHRTFPGPGETQAPEPPRQSRENPPTQDDPFRVDLEQFSPGDFEQSKTKADRE